MLGDGWVNVERLDSFNRYTIACNLWSGINRDLLLVDGLDDDKAVLEGVLCDPCRQSMYRHVNSSVD